MEKHSLLFEHLAVYQEPLAICRLQLDIAYSAVNERGEMEIDVAVR